MFITTLIIKQFSHWGAHLKTLIKLTYSKRLVNTSQIDCYQQRQWIRIRINYSKSVEYFGNTSFVNLDASQHVLVGGSYTSYRLIVVSVNKCVWISSSLFGHRVYAVSFSVGQKSLHPCLFLFITPSFTPSLSHIHVFLTSVSADLLANTTAVHKDT